jgi:transposase
MIRTYKRKLKLTKSQEQRISSWIGACRVVYNLGMEIKQASYKSTGKSVNKYDLINQLPDLKKDFDWIRDVPSQTLQASIERLDRSYQNFFRSFKKGGGYPKFASKKTFKWGSGSNGTVNGLKDLLQKFQVLLTLAFFYNALFLRNLVIRKCYLHK